MTHPTSSKVATLATMSVAPLLQGEIHSSLKYNFLRPSQCNDNVFTSEKRRDLGSSQQRSDPHPLLIGCRPVVNHREFPRTAVRRSNDCTLRGDFHFFTRGFAVIARSREATLFQSGSIKKRTGGKGGGRIRDARN